MDDLGKEERSVEGELFVSKMTVLPFKRIESRVCIGEAHDKTAINAHE